MAEYLYGGMFVLACVMIYFAYSFYTGTKDLIDQGLRTKGTVVDLIQSSSEDGYTYKPVFEYQNYSGDRVTFESAISSNPAPYSIGEQVHIIYSKDGEEQRVETFWGLYRWTIILLSFAAPLLIIGGGYLIYSRS